MARGRPVHHKGPLAQFRNKALGLGKLPPAKDDPARPGKGEGRHHTLIVAVTARFQPSYFASLVGASMAGVNRCSNAHSRANAA